MRRQIVYSRPRVDEGNLQPAKNALSASIPELPGTVTEPPGTEYVYIYTGGLPALFSR